MALPKCCLLFLGVLLLQDARAWSFVPGGRHLPFQAPPSEQRTRRSSTRRAAGQTMSKDGQFVRVSLPKPLGIQLEELSPGSPGVRVAGVVEGGTAKESGEVGPSMLLVELGGQDVTGATFDAIMDTLVAAPAGVPIDLVFRDPSVPSPAPPPPPPPPPVVACEVRVMSADGKELGVVKAKTGDNLRKALLAGKVEVYDMVGKMTNCNGGGQCGTCVVQVEEAEGWDLRSDWEAGKLKGRPESQRLACQTIIGGDATIITKPRK